MFVVKCIFFVYKLIVKYYDMFFYEKSWVRVYTQSKYILN